MADDTAATARKVAAHLQESGHAAHADRLHAALTEAGRDVRLAVREACQTILTAIEAIDPVSASMVDELRLDVDRRLGTPGA